MKRLFICIIICMLLVSVAVAQVSVGITPLYSRQTTNNTYLNQSFTDVGTKIELDAGIAVRMVSFRGFHLFKNTYTNTSNMVDITDKDKKVLPVQLSNCFCASRIEIGIPLSYSAFMLEPFFVDSYTKNCFTVTGEKVNYTNSIVNNSYGLGVFFSYAFPNKDNPPKQNISLKYYTTSKDDLIDLRYTRLVNKSSFGLGYTFRTYDNVTVSGPFLNVAYVF